ncbi:MAG: phosphopyruvate hydratase [Clostridia bacterium]|nr:phosphopyruvate hydratase [Clostridia bacterium]
MQQTMPCHKVEGQWILDSRGNPTVTYRITAEYQGNLISGVADVPSGASTGSHEAHEKRDQNPTRFLGKGVDGALLSLEEISCQLHGTSLLDQLAWDRALCDLDGSENKERLGANAILAASLAAAVTASNGLKIPLYNYLGGFGPVELPVPMLNVINGGAHAKNNVDIQEFMILPVGAESFSEGLRMSSEVYHTLKHLLEEAGTTTTVGDEGGFAPNLKRDEEALKFLVQAIESAGFTPGKDFMLAIDAAATDWYSPIEKFYYLPKAKKHMTSSQLASYWKNLSEKYPLISIEDGMNEDDHEGWTLLMKHLGKRMLIVGDDYFVTNPDRIRRFAGAGNANTVLIKPNQIGTLSETREAIRVAGSFGCRPILSHRSGETCDSLLADLACGLGAPLIKAGAPARGERTAKYNRLLEIERELGASARYAGRKAISL